MTQWQVQLSGTLLLASQISLASGGHNRRAEQLEVDSKWLTLSYPESILCGAASVVLIVDDGRLG